MSNKVNVSRSVFIALGANVAGSWGVPERTFERCLRRFESFGLQVSARSRCYETAPLGQGITPNYLNGVIALKTNIPPQSLLNLLKRLEKEAGRRDSNHWINRPLDLDIIDYKGRILNWDIRRRRVLAPASGKLILPHARVHLRPFVLAPLREIAADWRHPVLRLSLEALVERTAHKSEGRIIRIFD